MSSVKIEKTHNLFNYYIIVEVLHEKKQFCWNI